MMKHKKLRISIIGLVATLLFASQPIHTQLPTEKAKPVMQFATSLAPFFGELNALKAGKDTVVSIVHLGDSHVQAGHFSGRVMRLLQQEFGNAGRGWLTPLKLSRSNEPDDYFISSSAKEWIPSRAIHNTKKRPIGIGGLALQTASTSIPLDVSIAPINGAGYTFDEVILYRGEKSMPMLPTGRSKASTATAFATTSCAPGVVADTFRLSPAADTLLLHSSRRRQGTDLVLPATSFDNVYYGMTLSNGKPGILYHSIGVNGAMFVSYTDEAYVRQVALLKPSLLILSLGTNETFGRRFTASEFTEQARTFVRLLKKYLPHTAILLTTPPECYKKMRVKKKTTYVRNTNTQLAAKALVDLARTEGIACWDLFTETGGAHSSQKWKEAGMLGRDRVHFTKEGYQQQGTLLFNALINTYKQSNKTHVTY